MGLVSKLTFIFLISLPVWVFGQTGSLSQSVQIVKEQCKNDPEAWKQALRDLERLGNSNRSAQCSIPDPIRMGDYGVEALRRMKLIKEAQAIESLFTYELLYSHPRPKNKNEAVDQLIRRLCKPGISSSDFSGIAIGSAVKLRAHGDSRLNEFRMNTDLCVTDQNLESDFKKTAFQIAAATYDKIETSKNLFDEKSKVSDSGLDQLTRQTADLYDACNPPHLQPTQKTELNSLEQQMRSEAMKFGGQDRAALQAKIPERKATGQNIVEEINTDRVKSVIQTIAEGPFGRLLVTESFRKKLGLTSLSFKPNDLKSVCLNIRKKVATSPRAGRYFSWTDIDQALQEVRAEIPKTLADTIPYRYPQIFRPDSDELDRQIAAEIESQPQPEALVSHLARPKEVFARVCQALNNTESNRTWNRNLSTISTVVKVGLTTAGGILLFATGIAAPAGLTLLSIAGMTTATIDSSIDQKEAIDEFYSVTAQTGRQFTIASGNDVDPNQTQLATNANSLAAEAATQLAEKRENAGLGGIVGIATSAFGFGAAKTFNSFRQVAENRNLIQIGKLIGKTEVGYNNFGDPLIISAITGPQDFETFLGNGVLNFGVGKLRKYAPKRPYLSSLNQSDPDPLPIPSSRPSLVDFANKLPPDQASTVLDHPEVRWEEMKPELITVRITGYQQQDQTSVLRIGKFRDFLTLGAPGLNGSNHAILTTQQNLDTNLKVLKQAKLDQLLTANDEVKFYRRIETETKDRLDVIRAHLKEHPEIKPNGLNKLEADFLEIQKQIQRLESSIHNR